MEDDDYGIGGDAPASTDTMPEDDQMMGEPVLVNKELCEDCKVGDVLKVKVLKDHGKEMEISYVGKDGEEDDMPPGEPPDEMAESSEGEDSMMG